MDTESSHSGAQGIASPLSLGKRAALAANHLRRQEDPAAEAMLHGPASPRERASDDDDNDGFERATAGEVAALATGPGMSPGERIPAPLLAKLFKNDVPGLERDNSQSMSAASSVASPHAASPLAYCLPPSRGGGGAHIDTSAFKQVANAHSPGQGPKSRSSVASEVHLASPASAARASAAPFASPTLSSASPSTGWQKPPPRDRLFSCEEATDTAAGQTQVATPLTLHRNSQPSLRSSGAFVLSEESASSTAARAPEVAVNPLIHVDAPLIHVDAPEECEHSPPGEVFRRSFTFPQSDSALALESPVTDATAPQFEQETHAEPYATLPLPVPAPSQVMTLNEIHTHTQGGSTLSSPTTNVEQPSKSGSSCCGEDIMRVVITPVQTEPNGLSDTYGTRRGSRSMRQHPAARLGSDDEGEFGKWVASSQGDAASPRSAPYTPGDERVERGQEPQQFELFAPIGEQQSQPKRTMVAKMSGSGRCVSVEIPPDPKAPPQPHAGALAEQKKGSILGLGNSLKDSFRKSFIGRAVGNQPQLSTGSAGDIADSGIFDEPVSPTNVIVLGKRRGGKKGDEGGDTTGAVSGGMQRSYSDSAFGEISDRQDSARSWQADTATSVGGAATVSGLVSSSADAQLRERRRSKFKSIDYDDMTAVVPSTQRLYRAVFAVYPWAIAILIAITVAVVTYLITVGVKFLSEWKFELFYWAQSEYGLGTAYVLLVPLWLGLACVATLGVYHAPFAAGSGIPQVKAFLNGVDIPGSLELNTFLAKVIGITCCLGIGFPAGREGGTVHIGACIGAGLSKGYSKRVCCNFDWLGESMSALNISNRQEKKRHFVTLGAACGVASAFGAPIGGILFVIEVVASYWNATLTFQTFVASCVAGYLIGIMVSRSTIQDGGWVLFGVNGPQRQFAVWEIGAFVLIALGGGFFGSLFNACNFRMMKLRKRFLTSKYRKAAEAVGVIFMVMTVLFWLPVFFPCSPVPEHSEFNKTGIATMQYNCPDGEHNEMATLVHNPAERVLHQLFSRNTVGYFTESTLAVFFCCWFIMTAVLFGTAVPSGLMIPTMTMGAAWGRLIGEWLANYSDSVDPGLYALVGAAAELGGVMRLTLSLAAILVEVTNDIDHMLPIMLALTISRAIGSIANKSIYDYVLQNMGVVHLDAVLPPQIQLYKVLHVMSRDVHCLCLAATSAEIREALGYDHNAFPVVKAHHNRTFVGLITREQLELAYNLSRQKHGNPQNLPLKTEKTEDPLASSVLGLPPDQEISLAGYTHKSPPIVLQNASLKQAYTIFRSLGLRQLPVLDKDHIIVGIVTRADLGAIPEMISNESYIDHALTEHRNVHEVHTTAPREQRPVFLHNTQRRASIKELLTRQGDLDQMERGNSPKTSRGPSPIQQPLTLQGGLLAPPPALPNGSQTATIPPALREKKSS